VQTLYSGRVGYTWHRVREFVWTMVAFHVSKLVGYVPADATFAMHTRRFYTDQELQREVHAAGLRIRSRRDRRVLPGRALVVAGFMLEPSAFAAPQFSAATARCRAEAAEPRRRIACDD
jgi:hypothetical protein